MKTLLLPTLALLLTALPTFARLGETKAQCEARYGKQLGVTTTNQNPYYLKGGLQVIIGYQNDKAVFLFFTKLAPDTEETDLPVDEGELLSETERSALLQANAGTFKWKQQDESETADIAWDLSDGKGYAEYRDGSLEVRDKPGLEAWNKEKEAKLIAPFKDFPRLRESQTEIEKRCGKPVKALRDDQLLYSKSGYNITVTFWNGKVGQLSIQSQKLAVDPFSDDQAKSPQHLSENIITALLKTSGGGPAWEKDDADLDNDTWNRADKKAYATYRTATASLGITDEEYFDYQTQQIAKEAATKFKDIGVFGQTKADCQKLLGEPLTSAGKDPVGYRKSGVGIFITFWKERAAKITFLKAGSDDAEAEPESRAPILGGERDAILKANSDGSEWTESESESSGDEDEDEEKTTWLRADLQAIAVYDYVEKTLTIHAGDYIKHLQKDLNKKENENLDGF